jgi:hypothetical protein
MKYAHFFIVFFLISGCEHMSKTGDESIAHVDRGNEEYFEAKRNHQDLTCNDDDFEVTKEDTEEILKFVRSELKEMFLRGGVTTTKELSQELDGYNMTWQALIQSRKNACKERTSCFFEKKQDDSIDCTEQVKRYHNIDNRVSSNITLIEQLRLEIEELKATTKPND